MVALPFGVETIHFIMVDTGGGLSLIGQKIDQGLGWGRPPGQLGTVAMTEKIIEIEELSQTVPNQNRLVVLGDEPGDMFLQQHFVLVYQVEYQVISIV